ncbi:hypothetical protein GTR02_18280 [Kineococcus sp. R8]|uniref:hypothetical protein n=1 Tax=Kineococcus siccus TaxID=2696567 RepID=UPI0014131EBF|nr:hypothetical protein [Kineococcus siccus]NAZ83764.1 hypothetical protein [Kineococcus siccus]
MSPQELAETLERAFDELSGPPAAVGLLHRTGNWLTAMDEAGFIEIEPPRPDDPEARPRARIAWLEALAAAEYGGALASRSLDVAWYEQRGVDEQPYGVEPDPDEARRDVPLLRLAASLAGAAPVDLCSELSGLDRPTTAVVLAALSSATQAHTRQYRRLLPDGRPSTWSGSTWEGPLYDWADAEAEARRCRGDGGAGAPWRQERLALYPAAEEEAAIARAAHANPHPVAQLPLSEHLLRVLGALRPGGSAGIRGGGRAFRRHRGRGEGDVDSTLLPYTRAEVEDWLGFALPTLAPLEEAGHRLVCLKSRNFWEPEGAALPARGSSLPNGEPMELSIALRWVPPEVDSTRLARHDDQSGEWVTGLINYSPFTRTPQEQPERRATSLTEPAGAYTGITVNDTRMGVQHSLPGHTRIGWSKQGPDTPDATGKGVWYGMALHLPLEPIAAVEFILASRAIG